MMRIAYVVNQYPKVSHTFIRREIDALRAMGIAVQTYAMRGWQDVLTDPADLAERERTFFVLKGGVFLLLASAGRSLLLRPASTLSALRVALSLWRRSLKPLYLYLIYWLEACVVAQQAINGRCQHFHAHFGTNPTDVAMLAAIVSGLPFSFTVHGPDEFDAPASLGIQEKIRRCAFVVAVSSFGRSQLFRHSNFCDWGKVEVVHCGLDAMFLGPEPIEVEVGTQLVCVGRLSGQKGQLLLLRALRRVLDLGYSCSLVFAGDGELRGEIEAEIDALSLRSVVSVTGWVSSAQVRDMLLSSRALVLPSFAEGLPVVIMEAMALGRPVVTTYIAGIPELVEDGVTGWLVPSGDVDALARALVQLLHSSEAQLARMGDAARARVRERHDASTEASKLMALFSRSASVRQ